MIVALVAIGAPVLAALGGLAGVMAAGAADGGTELSEGALPVLAAIALSVSVSAVCSRVSAIYIFLIISLIKACRPRSTF